jgi:hypothetical protein
MRKKHDPESDEHCSDRLQMNAQHRREQASAEDKPWMPPSSEASSKMAPNADEIRRTNPMPETGDAKEKSFTVFRSAAEEAETKHENDVIKSEEQSWDNEGGHMSSTAGRIKRVPRADLPYVVILAHHGSEATEHGFATMREAEAFIKRNTPVPGAVLSTTYDRPASASRASPTDRESTVTDEHILARLKIIDQRLRQISTDDAASVLAGGLANAGIAEHERLRLIAETERILNELDGRNNE